MPCRLQQGRRSSRNDRSCEKEQVLAMATSIWKGHLSFGLVSIPVKLSRAARAEKVSFRQVHEATGSRVRQALYRKPEESMESEPEESDRAITDAATGLGRHFLSRRRASDRQ